MIRRRLEAGLTLVEVLVSIVLLAIILLPAVSALQTAAIGSSVHSELATNHFRLTSRLEELLAEPFSSLVDAAIAAGGPLVPSSYSDAAGPPDRFLVYLSLYDGDNADNDNDPFTGTDPDLLWIQVAVEDTVFELQTITARGN